MDGKYNEEQKEEMVADKHGGILKEIWRLLYPMLIYFVIAFVVELGAIFIYALKGGIDLGSVEQIQKGTIQFINDYSIQLTSLINIILIPVFALFVRGDEKKRIRNGGYRYLMPPALHILMIVGLGMASAIGVNVIISISGLVNMSPKYQEVSEAIYSGGILLEISAAAIIAPIVEELLFRGLIFKRIRAYCNPIAAILISAAVFGIFHGNLVQFVYAFIIGCMLAYVYEKYKTLLAPIAFHMGANLIAVIITEFLDEQYLTVVGVLAAMVIGIGLSVYFLIRVSKYKVRVK